MPEEPGVAPAAQNGWRDVGVTRENSYQSVGLSRTPTRFNIVEHTYQ
jgi:hypothetical protein